MKERSHHPGKCALRHAVGMAALLALTTVAGAAGVDDGGGSGAKKKAPAVYEEMTLEDFEKTPFGPDSVEARGGAHAKAELTIDGQFPSSSPGSTRCLAVRVFAASGDYFKIRFPKEIAVNRHCTSISLWVNGNRFPGELLAVLTDAAGTTHIIAAGSTDFTGWKKITLKLDNRFRQDDEYLNQKRPFRLVEIQYRCVSASVEPQWQFFSIDDITARVREKYIDHRSDDW